MTHPKQGIAPTWLKWASVCAIAVLTSCASTTPEWDTKFGDSARGSVSQQIINPDASLNPDPVYGIDGRAAESAMQRYHQSFKNPTPQANVLSTGNVGTGTGTTTGTSTGNK